MFNPGEVIYGTVNGFGFIKPKPKYLIVLYRDDQLTIATCFTTSQERAGVPPENLKHGAVKDEDGFISYVFLAGVVVGQHPESGEDFAFPLNSTVTFDYGLNLGELFDFQNGIENAELKCLLSEEEFGNLLYAMYSSHITPRKYKPYLEKSLNELYGN